MGRRVSSPVLVITAALFLDFAALTLAIPLLPFWAERLGATPLMFGGMTTGYALAQLAFTPILGGLSDRYGRKPIILMSLLLSALSFGLTAIAGTLAVLVMARLIGGLGASIVGAAQAIVSDQIAPQERARAMGMTGAAIGLGHVAGPALGGALSGLGLTTPFWVATAFAVGNTVLVWALLPETHRISISEGDQTAPTGWFTVWGVALRAPILRQLALVGVVFTVAIVAIETVFALFTNRVYGWTAIQNGWVLAYMGLLVVLMQLGMIGRLVTRFGERRVLAAGLAVAACGFLLLPLSGHLVTLIAAVGLIGLGMGAVSPTLPALLSLASPAEAQGAVLGVAQGASGVGRLLGPLLAGGLFSIGVGLPFLLGGVLCVLGIMLLPGVRRGITTPVSQSTLA